MRSLESSSKGCPGCIFRCVCKPIFDNFQRFLFALFHRFPYTKAKINGRSVGIDTDSVPTWPRKTIEWTCKYRGRHTKCLVSQLLARKMRDSPLAAQRPTRFEAAWRYSLPSVVCSMLSWETQCKNDVLCSRTALGGKWVLYLTSLAGGSGVSLQASGPSRSWGFHSASAV